MQVTEVRVKLMARKKERLKAFCSVTLDGEFVVRDVKVIEGTSGLFVAMPSRRLSDRCPMCRTKNPLRARFCNECGARLDESRAPRDAQGRLKLHVDIAHPINAACRQAMEKAILEAYDQELERSQEPGYVAPQIYDEEEEVAEVVHHPPAAPEQPVEEPVEQQTEQPANQVEQTNQEQAAEGQEEPTQKSDEEQEHKFGQGIL